MSESSRCRKETSQSTINQYRVVSRRDTTIHSFPPLRPVFFYSQREVKTIPIHPIICFFQIQYQDHTLFIFCHLVFYISISNRYTIINLYSFQEHILSPTTSSITSLRRVTKILDIILYTLVTRLNGQESLGFATSFSGVIKKM